MYMASEERVSGTLTLESKKNLQRYSLMGLFIKMLRGRSYHRSGKSKCVGNLDIIMSIRNKVWMEFNFEKIVSYNCTVFFEIIIK